MDFNYKIINEKFENNKVWIVIIKFSTLTTLKKIVEFNSNLNFKIFDFPNNKFELIFKFSNKIIIPKHGIKNFILLSMLEE